MSESSSIAAILATLRYDRPDRAASPSVYTLTDTFFVYEYFFIYEDTVKTVLSTLLLLTLLAFAVAPVAAQSNERVLVGQVQSLNESGTVITLTDGTRLLISPGDVVQPLEIGMLVVAVYRVHDNGDKVVMRLWRGQIDPALDNPQEAPGPESPSEPAGVTSPTKNATKPVNFVAPCVGLPIHPPIIFGAVCA